MKSEIIEKILPNGLKAVHIKNKSKKIVIVVGVRVGLIDEDFQNNGVSHFLEHMLLEGTNSKSGGEIRKLVKQIGGKQNASTSVEESFFFIQVPRKNFDTALELVAEIITKPAFDEKTISKEKGIIINEIAQVTSCPEFYATKMTHECLFSGHILSSSVPGTKESVEKIDRNMLEQHYSKYYVPGNMVVTINGDVEDPFQKIEKLFNIQPKFVPVQKKPEKEPALPIVLRKPYDTKASYLELTYLHKLNNSKEMHTFKLIEILLSQSNDFGLMEELRHKRGLTYDIGVWAEWFSSGCLNQLGLLSISLNTEKKNIQEAVETIKNQTTKIQELNKKDLEQAKKSLIKHFKEGKRHQTLLSRTIADHVLSDRLNEYEQTEKEVKSITTNDVKELAKKCLNDNYVLAIVEQRELEGAV